MSWMLIPLLLVAFWQSTASSPGDSLADLEWTLDRAVTLSGGLLGKLGDDGDCKANAEDFDHVLDFLQLTGARYAGRAAFTWAQEASLPQKLAVMKTRAEKVHKVLPELVVEACIFEVVSMQVESLEIPARVFKAYGLAAEARNFSYDAMLFPDGWGKDRFGQGKSVPDYTQQETKLWVLYAAMGYIDAGAEALHMGQVRLMGKNDPTRKHTWSISTAIHDYAKAAARRGFVLCNAHVFEKSWSYNGTLLMDFHAFPSRPRDVLGKPLEAQLRVDSTGNCGDPSHCHTGSCPVVPYRMSAGGWTFGGYRVDSLPYLVELDNWGSSSTPGKHVQCSDWTWGTDEIIWFGSLEQRYRQSWLAYAVQWLRNEDPRGHFEMPGLRKMQGIGCYDAHGPEFNDSRAIAYTWQSQVPPANTLRAGDSLTTGSNLTSQDKLWTFSFQLDANMLIYDENHQVMWSSGTAGSGGVTLLMQWDGNLVLLDSSGKPVWSVEKSAGNAGAYLLLQNDGNLVVYHGKNNALWSWKSGESLLDGATVAV